MPATFASPLYVLDTNILIHAVRGSETWSRIKAVCDPLMSEKRPLVCVVSDGELRSFAEQQQWNTVRRNQMLFLLGFFERADISSLLVLEAYARIDAFSRTQGIKMGKNDLWIAAISNVAQATLVTLDRDFDHLQGVALNRILVSPTP